MKRLDDVVHGRANNFHLLRLVAASAVLLSHSYPLTDGGRASEPLRELLGCTPGSIAVDLFFLISGLLVTISLVRRADAMDFVRARFFRIWPGLAVALLLTVFALGPFFTTLDIGAYFHAKGTWRYLVQNLVLAMGIDYKLPGVFDANPWPSAVNGSLWTLPSEVRCYMALLAGWFVLYRLARPHWFRAAVTATWLVLWALHVRALTQGTIEDSPPRLFYMFCSGCMLYLHRSRIVLSAGALLAVIAVAAACVGHALPFGLAYTLGLPYAMVCIAYLPGGRLLAFNRLGDYSYGTYIYAYPVQQAIVALRPGISPLALFGSSLATTLVFATLSWHFIEKPATRLARRQPAPSHTPAPAPAA